MKKKFLVFTIGTFALAFFTFHTDAVFASYEKGMKTEAIDTTEFKNTVMLPTDGINWESELGLKVKYPKEALEQGLEGEVVVLVTVDTEGNVSDLKIFKDIGGGAGVEVAKAVRTMKFNPAIQNGYATSYTMAVPVLFYLDK